MFTQLLSELENYVETWEDEEDEHLARSVYEHMQLNEKQVIHQMYGALCLYKY